MKNVQGWWLPDREAHIDSYFDQVGRPEYQPIHQNSSMMYCKKFRTAIDIGAHIGLWARGLTNKFESVVCFEPCEEFVDILVKNAPDIAAVHKCALGDKQGNVKLNIQQDNTGMTHVIRGEVGSIPMYPLDHFGLDNVDFIKIDVEGYELEVVKGGYETFKRNSPVVIIEQKTKYAIPEQGNYAAVRFLMRELQYRVLDRVIDDWILGKV